MKKKVITFLIVLMLIAIIGVYSISDLPYAETAEIILVMIVSMLISAVILTIYMIPFFIAILKDKKHTTAIFMVNALLGFTGIGWLVALMWATTDD